MYASSPTSRASTAAGVALLACASSTLAGCDDGALAVTPPYLNASAERIDFGERVVGMRDERTIYIVNTGQVPLSLQPPVGDTLGGIFGVLVDNYSIRPDKDSVISVVFAPADPITYTTTITIANDSSNRSELHILLTGKGVRPGPCDNVDCRVAPRPTCVAEDTTRRYEPSGTCEDGRCVHVYHDDTCDFGCDDATGACRPDPCVGMSCSTPPNNCYLASGTCVDGACRFDPNNDALCNDNLACTTGDHCSEGTCVGTPVECASPPAPLCVDATTRRVFDPAGACNPSNGGCEYKHQDQHCEFGCAPEGCAGDPCENVACDTPPAGQCWEPVGTCAGGQCTYLTVGGPCDDGDACTTGDACNAGLCTGTPMVCASPPPPDCATAADRRVYNATGTCSQGLCTYAASIASCNDNNQCTTGDACQQGACTSSGTLGCNDGDACTSDTCSPQAGCVYTALSGTPCVTGSSECPSGSCSAGSCLPVPNVTCVTEIQLDLCQDVEVAGLCSGAGECVVSQAPPGFTCPGCNGICIQCFIQLCIPFGP